MTEIKGEKKQKYSKIAFLDAASDNKERLLLNTLLQNDKSYTKEEVEKIAEAWKSKNITEEPKEVEA